MISAEGLLELCGLDHAVPSGPHFAEQRAEPRHQRLRGRLFVALLQLQEVLQDGWSRGQALQTSSHEARVAQVAEAADSAGYAIF